ncbi:MAG: 4-hydroxy-tetrahydrodipicolinate synthase [Oscillibacter sp.]|nr:4-hydroxy-tetrahydrodipicolinate synthase [Oscillibacter sp.]
MKQPIFTGVATAIITPFKGGMVDYNALARQLDFQIKGGVDAIVVCGTTGEASTMSYHERLRTIEYCVEHVNGRVPVIAGSGSNSTENAVALSRDARRSGADALLTVTPYYNKATQAGLIRHFSVIADAVDIPLILYSVPSRTGVAIAPETYAALARHGNIAGTKEASGSLTTVARTRALCPADFSIWSGNDDETVPIWALGGKGVISVAANLIPEKMHRLTTLCAKGDFAAAGQLQVQLKAFIDMLFCEVNPIPVKTAMAELGWDYGELRLPLCKPSEEHLALIRKTLADYNLYPETE